ncbi:Cardiolipin synthase [Novipirellula aureliae]|uniref:Cardiolipin synthase n=1 Tax=Novipirellula aureliae TaxID=2527966 RepID=A0A5C6E6E4_9BACT|nr:cardiolipin synthase [Novipirellula aureliae]TWU44185.1 Cardiolipin synthase [Novipirellula aureliae]
MNNVLITTGLLTIAHFLLQVAFVVRVILRPHRQPASRIAWIVVIIAAPVVGMIVYLLLGETNVGRSRVDRMKKLVARLSSIPLGTEDPDGRGGADVPPHYAHLFQAGKSVNGFNVVGGNRATLMEDSNSTIESLIADIDAAALHVHLMFYIWLPDNNGCKVVEALKRAAQRGVTCRAMADDLGSRTMIASQHWQAMKSAGVHLAATLPLGNLLLRPLHGRIDLRNHRKIAVIDNKITYCGSQNCADPEFLVKAKYAPWVDVMMRFEGPIVQQNQVLFASDWMSEVDEDLSDLLREPQDVPTTGFPAQVIGTGPTIRTSAMPEIFELLMYSARRELVITTPYYIPDEPMQTALCASARRGVETSIVFPARNDSWIVGTASRSYYEDLLAAGVNVYEFEGGLLHAKTLTLDREVTLIGSANMDRRSFELNYENNILFYDPTLTTEMRQRQDDYISQSSLVSLESIAARSWRRRLIDNTVAMLGPVL